MHSRFKLLAVVFAIFAILAMASPSFAVKANDRKVMTFTQPDGKTIFKGFLKGDEHFNFAEDEEGFSFICRSDGWWTYAKQQDGLLVPTEAKVGINAPPYQRHLRPNAAAVAAIPSNQGKQITLSNEDRHTMSLTTLYGSPDVTKEKYTGVPKRYINILLGDFTDSSFAYFSGKPNPTSWPPMPTDTYRHLLAITFGDRDSARPVIHDSTSSPSLTSFYWDMSYGKLYFAAMETLAPSSAFLQVVGVDTIRPSGYTWAGANAADINYMKAVVAAADPYVFFKDPSSVTARQTTVGIIHPGPCETESGRTGDIWSFSYNGFKIKTPDLGLTGSSPKITTMFICPQGAMLGVFAHECYHALGGPDLYDYGYSGNPWGEWSVMDMGSYNGPNIGDQPSFVGGHLMYDLDGNLSNGINGWLDQKLVYNDSISSVRNGDGVYTVACLDSAGEFRASNPTSGIRLWRVRNNNFRDSSELFFVENRRKTPPYEVGLPEEGLIITHINTRMVGSGVNFNGGPPAVAYYYSWVEQPGINPNNAYAIGDTNYNRNTRTAAYSANDFNAIGDAEDAIDTSTTPNCLVNGGTVAEYLLDTIRLGGPRIFNISDEGLYMTFNVSNTGMAAVVPMVGYVSNVLLDTIITGTANNNNSLMDPWESDSIKVNFRNAGTNITAGAQCSLYVITGSEYITITSIGWRTVGTGVLNKNTEAISLTFPITIIRDVPRFTDVVFGVKFKSTAPVYSTDCNFGARISGLVVAQVYDFQDIRVGGTTFDWRIQPSDVALYRDTLFVCNANLDHTAFQTRCYAIPKNTTNVPLVGGPGGDTLRSMNNSGSVHVATKYGGGIDIDKNGDFWISLQDSIFRTNRAAVRLQTFKAPNVSWGGTPMLRVRGVGFGPTIIDTVGPDPISGDSLWAYWQNYGAVVESAWVLTRPASGTAQIALHLGWDDLQYGAQNGSFWNGRGIEYDGSSIWTTSVNDNYLLRKNPLDGTTMEIMPAPSSYGSYGTYGVGIEATTAAGVSYQPVGTLAYAPGAFGTRHYLYCASMDEGVVYKVDMTSFVLPTPPDSIKVISGTPNVLNWWKANADAQKVAQYIVYRQPALTTTPPTPADEIARVSRVFGAGPAGTYTDVVGGAYVYNVRSVNYYGEGEWGASANALLIYVNPTNYPPGAPTLYKLFDNARIPTKTPTVSFSSRDMASDQVDFEVSYDTLATFATQNIQLTPSTIASNSVYTLTFAATLKNTHTYYWRVRARDPGGSGNYGDFSVIRSFTVDTLLAASSSCSWLMKRTPQYDAENEISKLAVTGDTVILKQVAIDTLYFNNFEITSGYMSDSLVNSPDLANWTWTDDTLWGAPSAGWPDTITVENAGVYWWRTKGATRTTADTIRALLQTPVINCSTITQQASLTWYGAHRFGSATFDTFAVRYSITGGATWSPVTGALWQDGVNRYPSQQYLTYTIPAFIGQPNCRLFWKWCDIASYGAGVDNVLLTAPGPISAGYLRTSIVSYTKLNETYPRANWGYIHCWKRNVSDSIKIQLEFFSTSSGNWEYVPDGALPGNAVGFLNMASPTITINTTALNPVTYELLRAVVWLYRGAGKAATVPVLRALEIGSVNAAPLAVSFTSMAAQVTANGVMLSWRTESEINCSHWEIERSTNETAGFELIGKVRGNSTTNEAHDYSYTDAAKLSEGVYYYRLAEVDINNYKTYFGPVAVKIGNSIAAPLAYLLEKAYPNPMASSATIKYALKNEGRTSLKIYNVLGQEVKTLVNGNQAAGFYLAPWNGRDNTGQQVSNGIYFYKLVSGDFTATQKMMVLR